MSKFSEEVLRAANLRGTEKLYPFGVGSYDRFPEVAERLGWVQSRLDNITTAEAIPTSWGGLLELADRMAEDKSAQDRLDERTKWIMSDGEVWGWPSRPDAVTVDEWLDGIRNGKDLLSDHDSPVAYSSLSKLVFKSMGHWRMQPDAPGMVHLECRGHSFQRCIPIGRIGDQFDRLKAAANFFIDFASGDDKIQTKAGQTESKSRKKMVVREHVGAHS